MMTETNPFLRALFGEDKPATNGHSNGTAMPAKLVGEATAYGEKALNLEVDAVLNTPEGQRNDRLNTAAFNLAQLVAGGELNQADVEASLTLAGHTAGLDSREIPATIRSGISAGLKLPRNAPPRRNHEGHKAELDPNDDEHEHVWTRCKACPYPGEPCPCSGERCPDCPDVAPEPVTQPQPAFWASRDRLQALHDWARARRVSPWAVLGVALTRVVAATDHRIVIPPITGGIASLNMFVGLVGSSGAGKGAAEAVAAEALPIDDPRFTAERVGSGEGIAHSYMKREKGDTQWRTHACLFSVTEIDTFHALGQRQASTLIPELRSAWSGETLGFAYADPGKRLPIPRHEYRLCLIVGIQPARAGALLNDSDGGTPQRFLWLPATDRHAPDDPPGCPDPIAWRRQPWEATDPYSGTCRIDVTQTAVDTIDQARVARLRGEGDALDGHALLCRLKTAVALALLDERLEVTDQDWGLAGVVQDVSDRTRAGCETALADAARTHNEARARSEADRTLVVQERLAEDAAKRVTRGVIRLLAVAGNDGLSHSELRRQIAYRDRGNLDESLERAVKAGQIDTITTVHGARYKVMGDH